jgi:hypothetical protein
METMRRPAKGPDDSPSVPDEGVHEPPPPAPGGEVREPPLPGDRPQERLPGVDFPGDDEERDPGEGGEGGGIKRKLVS